MGSPKHRKATALGEIPGKSRRLQTAAKILRDAYGDRDRFVVDGTIAQLLAQQQRFRSHDLGAGVAVKDMDERTLYFWETSQSSDKR